MENKLEQWKNMQPHIYPWVKQMLYDTDLVEGRQIDGNNTPMISFVGDLLIVFVIKKGEKFQVLDEAMVPDIIGVEQIYHTACENLVRDTDFSFSRTLFGGFGLLADGHHEASSLCLKHIWSACADKLEDDLVIAVPAKDTVLFVLRKEKEQIKELKQMSDDIYRTTDNKVTKQLLVFSKAEKELHVFHS